jgi:hypothetical protein
VGFFGKNCVQNPFGWISGVVDNIALIFAPFGEGSSVLFSHGASISRRTYRTNFIPGLNDVWMVFEKTH